MSNEPTVIRHQRRPSTYGTTGASSTHSNDERLPIPPRSQWQGSCVPWRYLLMRFGARVHRGRIIRRLPWHLVFLSLQLAAAIMFQNTAHNTGVVSMLHEVVGGPATAVFSPGFQVNFEQQVQDDTNESFRVTLRPLLGPSLGLNTIQSWRQWQVLLATVVGEGWCSTQSGLDSSVHTALCVSPSHARLKDADKYKMDCLDIGTHNAGLFNSSSRLTCQKRVTDGTCLAYSFLNWKPNNDDIKTTSTNAPLGRNECWLKEGTGPLDRCQYQAKEWDTVELSCMDDAARAQAVSELRFNDGSATTSNTNTEIVNNRTRVVSTTVDFVFPGTQLEGHLSLLAENGFAGGLRVSLDTLVSSVGNTIGITSILLLITVGVWGICAGLRAVSDVFLGKRVWHEEGMIIDATTAFTSCYLLAAISTLLQRNHQRRNPANNSSTALSCDGQAHAINDRFVMELLGLQVNLTLLQVLQVFSLIPQAELLRTSLVKSIRRLVPMIILLMYFYMSFSVASHITFGSASLRFVSLSSSVLSLNLLAIAAQLSDTWESMRSSLGRDSYFASIFFLTFEFVFFWFLNAVVLSIVVTTYMHSLAKHNETMRLARRWAADANLENTSLSCSAFSSSSVSNNNNPIPHVAVPRRAKVISASRDTSSASWTLKLIFCCCFRRRQRQQPQKSTMNSNNTSSKKNKHGRSIHGCFATARKIMASALWRKNDTIGEIEALERLTRWSRNKNNQAKTFITFEEIKYAIAKGGRGRGGVRSQESATHYSMSLLEMVDAANVYTIASARNLERVWERNVAHGQVKRLRHHTAEEIAVQSGRLSILTTLGSPSHDVKRPAAPGTAAIPLDDPLRNHLTSVEDLVASLVRRSDAQHMRLTQCFQKLREGDRKLTDKLEELVQAAGGSPPVQDESLEIH